VQQKLGWEGHIARFTCHTFSSLSVLLLQDIRPIRPDSCWLIKFFSITGWTTLWKADKVGTAKEINLNCL
jgi:hypothetical protein